MIYQKYLAVNFHLQISEAPKRDLNVHFSLVDTGSLTLMQSLDVYVVVQNYFKPFQIFLVSDNDNEK